MVKKSPHDIHLRSPKKDFLNPKSSSLPQHPQDILNTLNMMPSNNLKKTQKEGKNGSNQTSDNPQIDEQRQQTNINGFNLDLSLPEDHESSKLPSGSSGEPNDSGNGDSSSSHQKKDTEYIKFFKFYYDKTKNEHPNWVPSQITTIVSLLWKKKKNIEKAPSKTVSVASRKSTKPLAPKDAFRMQHKDLTKDEVDELWNKLPKESKNYWKKEGNAYCSVSAQSSEVSSMKEAKNTAPVYNSMRTLLLNF